MYIYIYICRPVSGSLVQKSNGPCKKEPFDKDRRWWTCSEAQHSIITRSSWLVATLINHLIWWFPKIINMLTVLSIGILK